MSALEVVAGIIERADQKVLIAQRPTGKRLAGQWEFPGGKIEEQEEPSAALERELLEELELPIEIIKYLGVFSFTYEWGAVALHVFVVKALGEPRNTESVQNFRWLPAHDIDPETLAAADRAPLLKYLNQSGPSTR